VNGVVGLDRNRVRIEPYQPEWQERYAVEVERLSPIVDDRVQRFEHVGSTAVVGMPAKPIIDILALVEDLTATTPLAASLEDAGYALRSEDDERLFFANGPETDRTHYLHVAETESEYAREMLSFRDRLRSNPDVAEEYADLKRSLVDRFPENRTAYTEHKEEFVERILKEASSNR
jgi:GrpB-like predicted nucleotidyltransferase (UPF0157 family)